MDLEPIVVEVKPPKTPFKLPFKMPQFGNKSTKIITIIAAAVILLSIGIFVVFTSLVNNDEYRKKQNIVTATDEIRQNSSAKVLGAALPGNTEVAGKGGTTGTNAPAVTLTASQGSAQKGSKVTLKWSVTNNPKSCVASDDWSGQKSTSGSEQSPNLVNLQTYLFTLTCKTDTGTGFSTVSVSVIESGGTGQVGRPVVTIAATPTSPYVGQTTTLHWTVSNNASSCTANDDWSGSQNAVEGYYTTPSLTAVRSYKYTLTCSNSSGSGYATTTITTLAIPADRPVVSIATNPVMNVTKGNSASVIWDVTNAATTCTATLSGNSTGVSWSGSKNTTGGTQSVGTFTSAAGTTATFTLTCVGPGGSGDDSATLTVIDPTVTIGSFTAAASTIYTGSSPSLSWTTSNTSGANPCTAKDSWTGAKPASGTNVQPGTISTPGIYTYTLTCSGTSSSVTKSVSVTASTQPSPAVSLTASATTITTGNSVKLNWSATNTSGATPCTASRNPVDNSGVWAGAKASSGTNIDTGVLTTGSYTYTLNCSNSNPAPGTNSVTITVTSGAVVATAAPTITTFNVSPTSVGANGSATINWAASNIQGITGASCAISLITKPTGATALSLTGLGASGSTTTGSLATGGSYTYRLTCTNNFNGTSTTATSATSNPKDATLTVGSSPGVTLTPPAARQQAAASFNIAFTTTNSPTSCTLTWSGGSKTFTGASGNIALTAVTPTSPTTTSFSTTTTYTANCTNTYGSGSATTNVTSGYCAFPGATPPTTVSTCYGASLATHNTNANCYAYQTGSSFSAVFNLTTFATKHSGGSAEALSGCGGAINWTGAPSNAKHTAAKNNTGTSALIAGKGGLIFLLGYYDSAAAAAGKL